MTDLGAAAAMTRHRPRRRALVATACVVAAIGPLLGLLGARINTTPSLAYGVYWVTDAAPQVGRYITFCPPLDDAVFAMAQARGYLKRGPCAGQVRPLLKRVLAGPGDRVAVVEEGVRVNGVLLDHSRPNRRDFQGRALPALHVDERTLHDDELLVMSDTNDLSFDSRYYGPIPRSLVRDVIRPVITWQAMH